MEYSLFSFRGRKVKIGSANLVRYDEKKKKEKRSRGGKRRRTNEGIFIIIFHPPVNRSPMFPRELINFPFFPIYLPFFHCRGSFEVEDAKSIPTRSCSFDIRRISIASRRSDVSFFFFFFSSKNG